MRRSFTLLPRMLFRVREPLFSELVESNPHGQVEVADAAVGGFVLGVRVAQGQRLLVVICQSMRGENDMRLCGRVRVWANATSLRLASSTMALMVEFESMLR